MKKIIFALIITTVISACGSATKERNKGLQSDEEFVMSKFNNGAAQITWEYGDVNGKRVPVYQREYNADSTLFKEGAIQNQRREGTWKSYYPDGTLWSENIYTNGLINGKTITYFPNGNKRYEGYFENDSKIGVWKFWNEEGEFVKEVDMDKKD